MIDDKKIEEAAQGAADLYEQDLPIMSYNEDTEVDGQHHFCQEFGAELFKDGAKWAINEFLKNLWHPMKEEPKLVGEEIIIEMFLKGKRHTIVLEYMVGEKEPIAVLESVRWITDWNSFIQPKENVIKYRWCYLKDLFPKEGGE